MSLILSNDDEFDDNELNVDTYLTSVKNYQGYYILQPLTCMNKC